MEREQYLRMRAVLRRVYQQHHHTLCHGWSLYSDSTILLVASWAALHNKPMDWAVQGQNWPADLRPRGGLPSQSCMSRRLRGLCRCRRCIEEPGIFRLLELWQKELRKQLGDSDIKLIDGRGLAIGGCSKDPDAGFGYTAGTMAKGYKLHWVIDGSSGAVDGWLIAPMHFPEQAAARHLIEHLPEHTCYVLGDNNYDRNPLYEQAGFDMNLQWMALPRKNAKQIGHGPHSNWRLAVRTWLGSPPGRRIIQKARIVIEQVNGRLGSSSVGLNHLPYHARRLHRVTLWSALKLLILTDLQAATYHRWH